MRRFGQRSKRHACRCQEIEVRSRLRTQSAHSRTPTHIPPPFPLCLSLSLSPCRCLSVAVSLPPRCSSSEARKNATHKQVRTHSQAAAPPQNDQARQALEPRRRRPLPRKLPRNPPRSISYVPNLHPHLRCRPPERLLLLDRQGMPRGACGRRCFFFSCPSARVLSACLRFLASVRVCVPLFSVSGCL